MKKKFYLSLTYLALLFLLSTVILLSSCSKYGDNSKWCDQTCRKSDKGIAENFILKLNKYDKSGYVFKLLKEKANDPSSAGKRWIVIEKDKYQTDYTTREVWVDGYYSTDSQWNDGYYDYDGNWVDGYYTYTDVWHDGYWTTVTDSYTYLVDQGYVAYNIDNYSYGMAWDNYVATRDANWLVSGLSPVGGNMYKDDVSGFIFEETSPSTKDLEKMGSFIESFKESSLANQMVADFGLSEDRALLIAKYATNWKKLSDRRAMTDADANIMFKQVFGFSATEARDAVTRYVQGERANYQNLVEKASKANGVSPEHINKLLTEYLK
ncbi:MAG: hypothetical protein HQK49_19305 [Oligoflexia bacterium]|nr:hypothetical protein [Oligoflexia bacterium]